MSVVDIFKASKAVSNTLLTEPRQVVQSSKTGKKFNMPNSQLSRHGEENYWTYSILSADSSGTQDFSGQVTFRIRDIYGIDRSDLRLEMNQVAANTPGNTADLGYTNAFALVKEAELIINGEVVERWNPVCQYSKYQMLVSDDKKAFTKEKYNLGSRAEQVARNDAGSQVIYIPLRWALDKFRPNTQDIRSKEIQVRVTFARKEQAIVCDLLTDKDVNFSTVKINAMELQVKHRRYNKQTMQMSLSKMPIHSIVMLPEIHSVDVANSEAKITLQFLNGVYPFIHMWIGDRIADYNASGADLDAVNETENYIDNAKHTAIATYRLELNGNPTKYTFNVNTEFHDNQIVMDTEVSRENTYFSGTMTSSRILPFCDDMRMTLARGVDTGFYEFTGRELLKLTYATLASPRALFIIAYKAHMMSYGSGGVTIN